METYLARSDRVIAHAEATIALQKKQVMELSAGGSDDAAAREAKAALALMVERLTALRESRETVKRQITRPAN